MKQSNSIIGTKTLLLGLKISQWSGRKFDDHATETVQKAHKTKGETGNYTKRLLPGAVELEEVHRKATQIRKFYYEQTLPWGIDGVRIIKSDNYMPFMQKFNKMKMDYEKSVKKFVSTYPDLQKAAKSALGTLYSADEYPDVKELRVKFECDISIHPLASVKDFRVDLSENDKKKYVRQMKTSQNIAMKECWQRVHDIVKRAADKLGSKDAIFRDSLVENISEICKLLPMLNIADDPKLESVRLKIEGQVRKMKPELLRENSKDRKEAASKLKQISKSMGAFMGDG